MCITLLQCLEYPGYEFLMSNKLSKAEFSSAIGPNSPGMWSEFSKAIRPNSLLVRVLQNPLYADRIVEYLIKEYMLYYLNIIIITQNYTCVFSFSHYLFTHPAQ